MYSLFDNDNIPNAGRIVLGNTINLKRIVASEFAKVKKYYHTYPVYMPPQNGIVKLLMSVGVPFNGDYRQYYHEVRAITTDIASSMSYTSESSVGKIQNPGPIYGSNSHEVILVSRTPFDFLLLDDWKNIAPIRILSHTYDNVNFATMGGFGSEYRGSAVVEVNLPLLACQYMAFRTEELVVNPDRPRSIQQFLRQFPFTNAFKSHFEISVINRFAKIILGEPLGPYRKEHPFNIIDIRKSLDSTLKEYAKYYKKRPTEYRQLLANIPTFTDQTADQVLRPPKLSSQRQVAWALNYAVVPYISMLVKIMRMSNSKRDTYFVTILKNSLRTLRADRLHYLGFDRKTRDTYNQYITRYIEDYI